MKLTNTSEISFISSLDSLLMTSFKLILLHAPSVLHKTLFVKALRANKVVKRR